MYAETLCISRQLSRKNSLPADHTLLTHELSRLWPTTHPEASNASLQTLHLSQNMLHPSPFPTPSSTANVHAPPQPCRCRWFRLHTPGPGLLHVRCPLDTQLPIYGSIGGQVKLSKVKDNTSPSLWVIIGHIVHI